MDLWQKLKRLFSKKSEDEALQSDSNFFQSALNPLPKRFKALESAPKFTNYSEKEDYYNATQPTSEITKLSQPVELQKESLQLGVAAGYTGRAIREIETSLARIESQMPSKDWFVTNFEDRTPELLEMLSSIKNFLEAHDSNSSKHLESIESALNRMTTISKTTSIPEPIQEEIEKEIETIRANLQPSYKMAKLIEVVKEKGEISYDELAERLAVSKSSLRGLLANTMKRSNELERYSIDNKGWVRYKLIKTD